MASDSEDENNFGDVEVIEVDNNQAKEWEDVESEDGEDLEENLLQSDAVVTFRQHSGSVICCDISPNNSSVVTGGQDDKAFLWDVKSAQVTFECTGHNETICSVGFSYDGKYFVTGDMNGLIQVWNTNTNQQVWTTDVSSELIWLKWHPTSHVIIGGTNSGEVWLWAIPSGNCKIFPSHGFQTDCGAFLPDGLRSIAGYSDGSIRILDLKKGTTLHHFKENGHQRLVSTIECYNDNVLSASGSEDCTVKLINTQSNKILTTFQCNFTETTDDSGVESIAFHPSQPTLVTGTLNGEIKIWDLPTQTETMSCNNESGVVKLIWNPNSPLIYAASLDGIIRRWDTRNGQLERQWVAHNNQILDMSLSKDAIHLITASDDMTSAVLNTS